MARREAVVIIDSLTGKELTEEQAQQVSLTVDNKTYSLDLSETSLEKLHTALKPFIEDEEPVGVTTSRKARKSSPSVTWTPEEREGISKFAEANDLPAVSTRGRIRAATVKAWEEAGRPM